MELKKDSVRLNPLFTLDKIRNLTNGDKVAMTRLNSVFIGETVEKDLINLCNAVDKGDFRAIKNFAHKMKPSIDLYGIELISSVVKDVESMAAHECDLEKINEMVSLMEDTLHKVRDEMNNLN